MFLILNSLRTLINMVQDVYHPPLLFLIQSPPSQQSLFLYMYKVHSMTYYDRNECRYKGTCLHILSKAVRYVSVQYVLLAWKYQIFIWDCHKLTGWLQTILRSIKIKFSDLFFPAICKYLQINALGFFTRRKNTTPQLVILISVNHQTTMSATRQFGSRKYKEVHKWQC